MLVCNCTVLWCGRRQKENRRASDPKDESDRPYGRNGILWNGYSEPDADRAGRCGGCLEDDAADGIPVVAVSGDPGATTIWEHWDSYTKEKGFGGQNAMNSFNHYSLGSVLSWLYHTGLGIQRDETKPGYQHILLKPQPGPLEFMKGSVDSPYGVISAGWERKGDKIEYQVTIPVNTTATLFKNTQDPADTVELGSGTYTLCCKENPKGSGKEMGDFRAERETLSERRELRQRFLCHVYFSAVMCR